MSKHTHTGSCQLCGRDQAVNIKTGRLSIHGYSVQWNQFVGNCPGSKGLPFEVSSDLIAAAAVDARKSAKVNREKAVEIRARSGNGGFLRIYVPARYAGYRVIKSHYRWVEAEFSQEEVSSGEFKYNRISAIYRDGDKDVTIGSPKHSFYSNTAAEEAAKSRDEFCKQFDQRAAGLDKYAEWLEERVANWKPGKLRAVKREAEVEIKAGDKFVAYDVEWIVNRWQHVRNGFRGGTRLAVLAVRADGSSPKLVNFQPHIVRKAIQGGVK